MKESAKSASALAIIEESDRATMSGKQSDPLGHDAPQESQDHHDSQELHRQSWRDIRGLSADYAAIAAMPLEEYIREAVAYTEKLNSEKKPNVWHSPLFEFARYCKAHPAITNLPAYRALKKIEDIVSCWYYVPPKDIWGPYFPAAESSDAARLDFIDSWEAVRQIPFHEVLQNALRLADERPLSLDDHGIDLYKRFIGLAGWLQILRGKEVIYLPTRKLDRLLGCHHSTISRLRKLAIRDHYLRVVKGHTYRPGAKGEATEFRFAVRRFKNLRVLDDPS